MRYLLDTNTCVDYLNGRYPQLSERFQRSPPEDLCMSSIVLAELRYGADRSSQGSRNHSRLDLFASEVRCFDFDAKTASVYGKLRVRLEAKGKPIGPHDMLIAAHALALDLTLVSDNVREFRRVQGLRVESWR